MKGEATLKVLEYVGDAAVGILDLTAAFLAQDMARRPVKYYMSLIRKIENVRRSALIIWK